MSKLLKSSQFVIDRLSDDGPGSIDFDSSDASSQAGGQSSFGAFSLASATFWRPWYSGWTAGGAQSPGAGGGSAPPSAASTTATTTSGGSGGFVFNNTFDASCSAAYKVCITAAEHELSTLFTNALTLNLSFHEASLPAGQALSNNWASWTVVNYATLKGALPSSDVLPSTNPAPSGSNNWYLPEAYARMLGLGSSTPTIDDSVTLNSNTSWSFGQDVINGLIHEITEGGMGRVGGLGDQNNVWSTMDLFRYTAAGVADYTDGRDGVTTYFSSNGGATTSKNTGLSFNNQYNSSGTRVNKGDTADWVQNSVFGSTGAGETLSMSQTELNLLAALGWNVSLPQEVMTASGNWETPTDWSDGFMPIQPEDAFIGVLNSVVATLTSKVTVNSIGTNTLSSLEISNGGHLIATNGTVVNPSASFVWASGNLGAIDIDVGSTLTIGNTFDNAGSTTVGVILSSAGGNGALTLNGAVTLNGSGALNLGQQSSVFQDDSTGSITGGGLVNVNNTIIGGGFISLSSLDNQSGGSLEANQAEGYALQIAASTFTNEGVINAEARSVVDLGADGANHSLTNTGTIEIQGQGDLAISGNFTISGSGAIDFKGAGAEITSDGFLAPTFTNDSTIQTSFSGQIGDVGILGVNDLTFHNNGTVAASGSGVTLTINTGGHTVLNGASGVLQAESGATLAIVSNVNNQGVIEAGSSSTSGKADLGKDGSAASMTDTGNVSVWGSGDLAISGNYTIGGSGVIDFKGAGAEITSDGLAAATFTNDSTIQTSASGQIGDVGILGVNDLTFHNNGTVAASGSGVTLTINTGGHSVLNGASGAIEAEAGAKISIASSVNNQGVIDVGTSTSSGTVDLGVDGAARSLTDAGAIGVYGGSDLAISGYYSTVGIGALYFKGAGAEITSDGLAAATFRNAGDIEVGFSGQIGDVGRLAVNDLTFFNSGAVVASGAGVTLKINTGGHIVNDGGGLLEAENGATLAIDSSVNTGQAASGSPPGGTVEAGAGGTVELSARIADWVSGASVTGQVVIDGGVFELLAGSSVAVPIEFTGGGTLELFSIASPPSVTGSNGKVDLTSSKVSISGGDDTIDFVSGAGDVANLSNTSGSPDTVDGSSGAVNLTSAQVSVVGAKDTITFVGGTGNVSDLSGTGTSADNVAGSHGAIGLTNANMALSGSDDAVTAGSSDKISLKSGVGDTFTGVGFSVTAASGTALAVGGNGKTGPAGTTDVVGGSGLNLGIDASAHVHLIGSNDTATLLGGSGLTVGGSNDTITATTGDAIWIVSGTGDTISGSGFAVQAGSGTGFTIAGAGDVVYAAASAAIVDHGSSTKFRVGSDISFSISGFGTDPTGIIDLLSGAGGYTTAAQAFAALTSDGAGGSLLHLGTAAAIDILGVAPSSLSVSNFKIG